MSFIKLLLISVLCHSFVCLIGQTKNVTEQSLYWVRYYNQININKKWSWHNEVDNRWFFTQNQQHHFIMHTRVHHNISKKVNLASGLTYSLQSPHEINPQNRLVVPEIRSVQDFTYNTVLNKSIAIQQRLRVEERFFKKSDGRVLLDGYDFNFRFRFRLQATYQYNHENPKISTKLKLSKELMLNAGKRIVYNHFDQLRAYFAIEQDLHKDLSLEVGYLYWYQQRSTGNQFFERDILRFTLYHDINF